MMATLLYVLALTLTLVASPAVAQLPRDATVPPLLQDLAEQGDAIIQYRLGLMYHNGEGAPPDYAKALTWYRRAAEQGLAGAQLNLGFMYAHGQGVPQNYAEAVQWFRCAAEQNDDNAQFNLSVMYYYGRGVPQNYSEAAQWCRRAAEQGFARAQSILGVMYALGHGVPQDTVQAHVWFNLASARMPPGPDRDNAVRMRDIVASGMTPTQLARAQEIARTWQPREESSTKPAGPAAAATALPPQTPPAPQRRDLIRQVQERLQASGFNPGTIDGAMGPRTRDALCLFQNTKGLRPTGEPDEATLDALGVR